MSTPVSAGRRLPVSEAAVRAAAGPVLGECVVLEETGSTMDDARVLSSPPPLSGPDAAGAASVVLALGQTRGRGRLGRPWRDGGFAATLVLVPGPGRPVGAAASLVAGLAVRESLGVPGSTRLKWPNDVVTPDGLKVAGVLCETFPDVRTGAGRLHVGVGVNLEDPGVPGAVSLRALLGGADPPAPEELCGRLVVAAARHFAGCFREGFPPFRAPWTDAAISPRTVVTVVGAAGRVTGAYAGVDDEGALLLDTPSGRKRFLTGDVTLADGFR